MTEFSKTPWQTDRTFDHEVVVSADNEMIADCNILNLNRSPAENQANARLIALAPEMLAVLEDITDSTGWCGCGMKEHAIVRKLIAQARGRFFRGRGRVSFQHRRNRS
jgi:hypothetical protein